MERVLRSIGYSSAYGICRHISKDVLHSIRFCPAIRDIWNLLIPTDQIVSFYSGILINRSYGNVLVQTDSLEVAIAIEERLRRGFNPALIRRIIQLFSRIQHWSIFHIPRDKNQEADSVVKLAHLDSQGLQVFEVSLFGRVSYVM
ncbi:hypothetical protein PVK06_009612 [Gossypium arboreum]|uniref:RNase H type-1 domain-containing protein n=1 Tax=Gossypium arboreum TaxID=29729 RepID=A0ABR0QNX1_GOSAR|nr:hypothetical protein PVK06_009612 [Gossypium arboreum]